MKLSASSYCYYQLSQKGLITQFSTIELAASMGFKGIEILTLTPPQDMTDFEYAKLLREEAERCNIEIIGYINGGNMMEPNSDEIYEAVAHHIDIAAELGAPLVRYDIGYKWPEDLGEDPDWRDVIPRVAALARRLAEYAQTKGIKFCCENHGALWQDPERLRTLFEAVNHPNYGFLFDIGNFVPRGINPFEAADILMPYIIHLHAKDLLEIEDGYIKAADGKRYRQVPLGEGSIQVGECVQKIRSLGYDGYVTAEYETPVPVFEGLARSADYIKSLGVLED